MNKKIIALPLRFVMTAGFLFWSLMQAPAVMAGVVPGSTQGSFSVGSSGAAQYAIPLTLPPGVQGVMPNLSFQYSSQGSNGLLGVGWSLGGLQTISRCPRTRAQDGANRAVSASSSDRFCLNGKRLVLVSGNYGGNEAEYRTELEEFSRVVSYTSDTERGPDYFKVWTKEGYVIELGNTADSRLLVNQTYSTASASAAYGYANTVTLGLTVLQWHANKVSDRNANYYTVTYAKTDITGEIYPSAINYTGNEAAGFAVSAPTNTVSFTYEVRPALADDATAADYPLQYLAGSKVLTRQRLKEVSVSADGVVMRKYTLTYQGVAKRALRSRLASVTECAVSAAGLESCYQPTHFDMTQYSNCIYDSYQSTLASGAALGDEAETAYTALAMDFDGDGRTDLLSAGLGTQGFRVLSSKSSNAVPSGTDFADDTACATAKKEGQSFDAAVVSKVTTTNHGLSSNWVVTAADVTGDGLPEVVAIPLLGTFDPVVAVRQSNGTYVQGPASVSDTSNYNGVTARDGYGGNRAWLVDVDGDGRQDVLAIRMKSTASNDIRMDIYVRKGRGDGTFEQTTNNYALVGLNESPLGFTSFVGDVDGDGRADIVLTSLRAGTVTSEVFSGALSANQLDPSILTLLDIDGTFITGVRSYLFKQAKFDNALAAGTVTRTNLLDVNRDGMADLVFFKVLKGTNQASILTAMGAQGGRFMPPDETLATVSVALGSAWSDLSTLPWQTSFTDINGDGYPDLLVTQVRTDSGTAKNRLQVLSFLNRGDGRFYLTDASWATNAAAPSLVDEARWTRLSGDFDGDGLGDLASVTADGTYGFTTYPLFSRSPLPDLLTKVTNGHGAVTQVVQAPLTRDEVYTKGTSVFPKVAVRMPLYVVKAVTQDSGNALAPLTWTYKYSEAAVEVGGRGFLGFASSTTTDPLGIVTTTTRSQTFPYTGMPLTVSSKKDGVTLSSATHTPSQKAITHASGKTTWFPFVANSIASQYEYSSGGALTGRVSTTYDMDAWGNLLSAVATTTGDGNTYTQTLTNTYFANTIDATTWRVGELNQKTDRRTGPLPDGVASDITRTVAYTYDGKGLVATEVVEPNNAALQVTTSITRDRFGNTVRASVGGIDIAARTATTAYDASGRFVTGQTNAKGHVTAPVLTDGRFGAPLSIKDANAVYSVRQYDDFGRVLREQSRQTDAGGTVLDGPYSDTAYLSCDFTCDKAQGERFIVRVTPQGMAPAYTYYDRNGRERRKVSKAMDGRDVITATEYDALGRVVRSSKPYFSGSSDIQWHSRTYDAIGRLSMETQPGARTTTYTYHARVVSATNPNAQVIKKTNDALGRLITTTDAAGSAQQFAYDAFGNVVRSTDTHGNLIINQYDLLGRKTRQQDPDLGTWNYQYNVLGQVIWQQDAKQQVTTFTYDILGRPLARAEPDLNSAWTWDTASKGIGKLATLTGDNGFERNYSYDGFGRPVAMTTKKSIDPSAQTSDPDFVHSMSYDSVGRPAAITYPTGFGYKNIYDAYGYLSEVRHKDTNALYWRADMRDAEGRVTRETLGNGLMTDRQYRADTGYLDTVQTGTLSGGVLTASVQNDVYGFDAIGNLITRSQYFGTVSLSEAFGYDSLNRLASATLGSTTKTVSYDAIGNVSQRSDVGSYGYSGCGGAHRVCAAGFYDFHYDANGNMLAGNGRSMTWTSYNYPQQITRGSSTESFLYTPERERVRRTSTENSWTTTTIYLNPRIDLGGTFEKTHRIFGGLSNTIEYAYTHHIYAGGQVIGSVVTTVTGTGAATKTRYFHADHLGSLTAVTDAAGAVIERLSYDAWGKRRHPRSGGDDTCSNLGGDSSEHGFTLHEHLDNVDLVHMNGRIYDPLIGRFLSADPNVFYPESMQDFNRYSYVHNNPLSYTDPSGFLTALTDFEMTRPGTTAFPDTIELPIYINNGVASFDPSGGSYYGISITISYADGVAVSTSSSTSAASNQHSGAGVTAGNGGGSSSGLLLAETTPLSAVTDTGQSYYGQTYGVGYASNGGAFTAQEGNFSITDAERQFVADGKIQEFWESRLAAGDPVARAGLSSLNPPGGVIDYLFGGTSINNRLQAFANVYADGVLDVDQIRGELANAHIRFTDRDVSGIPGLLNPGQIAEYHHQVFRGYGLPPTAFGGTPFTGAVRESWFTAPVWCGGCDTQ